jgi:hypothetical protein
LPTAQEQVKNYSDVICCIVFLSSDEKKPVVIFTIDRKVINTAFMKDGKKMRFPVPEYIPESELEEVPQTR